MCVLVTLHKWINNERLVQACLFSRPSPNAWCYFVDLWNNQEHDSNARLSSPLTSLFSPTSPPSCSYERLPKAWLLWRTRLQHDLETKINGRPRKSVNYSAAALKDNKCRAKYSLPWRNKIWCHQKLTSQRTNARRPTLWRTSRRTVGYRRQHNYFARCLIFLLFLWRRRVLFFFHFQRILAVDFLYGHPWPMINKLYFSTEVPVLAFCEKYNM